MTTLHKVTALIDWDTARRIVPCRDLDVRNIEQVIERLQNAIAQYIASFDKRDAYRVNWRIYHGWHQGKTKTKDRLLFEKFLTQATARTIKKVSFSSDYVFSGSLCCSSFRKPIVDTVRTDQTTGETRQKMVDTMLVCDLLHLARTREYFLIIVVANDDDFVPALYTAEAWKGRVIMLHNREHINSHLQLDGIAGRMILQ